MPRKFALRYFIDNEWNKPPLVKPPEVPTGRVDPSGEFNYGYADRLFLASIAYENEGKGEKVSSILLMDNRDGLEPSREILEKIKEAIEHYLEEHC